MVCIEELLGNGYELRTLEDKARQLEGKGNFLVRVLYSSRPPASTQHVAAACITSLEIRLRPIER